MNKPDKHFSLAQLAKHSSSELIGDPEWSITGVNTLEEASSKDASFLSNSRYAQAMKQSQAGVICIDRNAPRIEGKNYLLSDDPSRAFQIIAELLSSSSLSGFEGIHPTAIIHETAQIGQNVTIGPYAVIDRDARVGDHTFIGPHVSIGFDVAIGTNCILHPGAVIRERCRLGNRVILQPGAVIGSCGFGYTPDAQGHFHKLEQLGIVILEDDVEIGANTTIDRARFKATLIQQGTKIDNLCQIAHNVKIGKHNAIAAQTGLAGSTETGSHCMLGGQVGIVGHVSLENQVMVATRGGVSKSLKTGKYRGSPAIPIQEYNRQEVHVRKLAQYAERLKKLEQKVAKLEN